MSEMEERDKTKEQILELTGELMGTLRKWLDQSQEPVGEDLYRTALEHTNDGVIIARGEEILFINMKLIEMLGYDQPKEIENKGPFFAVHPEDRERVMEYAQRRQRCEPAPSLYDCRAMTKDGSVIHLEVSSSMIIHKGKPASLAIIRDVTERTRMEADLLSMRTLKSIGIIAGGMAHDFNNLLTAASGYIALARRRLPPGDEAAKLLDKAEHIALSGKEVTRELITFSKGGKPVKKLIDLNQLIRDASELFLPQSNISYEYSMSDNPFSVEADETQIMQVLHNVMINAKEAMPQGGTVEISTSNATIIFEADRSLPAGRYIKIAIKDNGVGIKEADLPKIFDPYFTTKKLGTKKGMGLGLTVAYSIIRRHNGHIRVDSIPGKGTTVSVYLPIFTGDSAIVDNQRGASRRYRAKILFMDDQQYIRDSACQFVAHIGYNAVPASNGTEAIALYTKALHSDEPFDAVVLNLTIEKGMGGAEAFRHLRAINPGIIGLICGGNTTDPVIARYSDYGFKGAIIKPFKLEVLQEMLAKIVPI